MKKGKLLFSHHLTQDNAVILCGWCKKAENDVQNLQNNSGVLTFFWSFEIATLGYHHVLLKGHM